MPHPAWMDEARPKKRRWLCNELICEFCRAIQAAITSDEILLTSFNIYSYLEHQFSKKRLIYQDAIAFLKARLDNNAKVHIQIDKVAKDDGTINTVIYQDYLIEWFTLITKHFRLRIEKGNTHWCRHVTCSISGDKFENGQMHYFLRLIAPLLRPIRLDLENAQGKSIAGLVRFLDAQSACIDSIELWEEQFNSPPIYRALTKYNALEIVDPLSMIDVPKLIHWLTKNNNGRPKKCFFPMPVDLDGDYGFLLNALKRDFVRAKSKRRFLVRLKLRHRSSAEFTLCNEGTGEMLELHFKHIKDQLFIHELRRFSIDELKNGESKLEEDARTMIKINFD